MLEQWHFFHVTQVCIVSKQTRKHKQLSSLHQFFSLCSPASPVLTVHRSRGEVQRAQIAM